MPSVTSSTHRAPVLSLLLARYIVGEIAENELFGLSDLFDETDASPEERAAFAAFYLEQRATDGTVALPKPDELADLLAAARA
jgi:hypothetical protein